MRILIVEDDREAASYLAKAFREAGHVADQRPTGSTATPWREAGDYDVLVVDRMLPKLDGLSLIRSLREQKVETPVLILSALGQVDDRVKGLRAGGDDYLPKPYAFSELLARVEVLARRRGAAPAGGEPTLYRVGDLELDRLSHRVSRAGTEIVLQPREFRLLEYLMKNAGQVVTRTMLLEHVWDYHFDPQTNVIDVHVSRLRAKVDKGFDKAAHPYGPRRRLHGPRRRRREGPGSGPAVSRRDRRPLGKLVRTTAFKLSAAYLVVFTVFAFSTLGYVAWSARARPRRPVRLDDRRRDQRPLPSSIASGGLRRLVAIVERRSRHAGRLALSRRHPRGRARRRQCRRAAAGHPRPAGAVRDRLCRAARRAGRRRARAIVRLFVLPSRLRLLVGRDVEERARLRAAIQNAFGSSLLLIGILGCAGAWFITRRVLKRVDDMTETTRTIMAGDLDGRLSIAGTGDELDRLAQNLNAMLDRIGELMTGLREVSDNIAHDLKTPLTRLRNKADEALRGAKTPRDPEGRPRSEHRGERQPHPHLQRAVDDRPARSRRRRRIRCPISTPPRRCAGSPSSTRPSPRRTARRFGSKSRTTSRCTAAANCLARPSRTSSTTP